MLSTDISRTYWFNNVFVLKLFNLFINFDVGDPEIFQRGGWGGKFWKKMFVDTRINTCTCTHKTRQTCNSFSLLPFQENCLLFFALFYYSLLFLKFERGVATPVFPPPSRSANDMYVCTCKPLFSHLLLCIYQFCMWIYPNFFEMAFHIWWCNIMT